MISRIYFKPSHEFGLTCIWCKHCIKHSTFFIE